MTEHGRHLFSSGNFHEQFRQCGCGKVFYGKTVEQVEEDLHEHLRVASLESEGLSVSAINKATDAN